MADTATNQVIRQIGPLQEGGQAIYHQQQRDTSPLSKPAISWVLMRCYCDGKNTLYRSYRWEELAAGGFAPAHGISLSPDERELYVSDWPNAKLHVFDIAGLPRSVPQPIADIPVHTMVGNDTPCVATNCQKERLAPPQFRRAVRVCRRRRGCHRYPEHGTALHIFSRWQIPESLSRSIGAMAYRLRHLLVMAKGMPELPPATTNAQPRPTKPGSAEGIRRSLLCLLPEHGYPLRYRLSQ